MKYAEKYGFTPGQVEAIKAHETALGVYDGRFEKDAPADVPEEKPAAQVKQPEVKRGPGRPSKGGM